MSEKTVIKLSIAASPSGADFFERLHEIEGVTPKFFNLIEAREAPNKLRVRKSEIGEITFGVFRSDMIDRIFGQIYCYESERDEAKKRLLEFAAAEIQKRIDAGNAMMQKLEEIL